MTEKEIVELLKPRYKVIADYPRSVWSVGQIIQCHEPAGNFHDGELTLAKYPHLFKRLEWWEERTWDENKAIPFFKCIAFTGPNDEGEVISNDDFVRIGYTDPSAWQYFTPATREEYEAFITSKPQP